jgi:D-serine dehydratase
VGRRDISFDQTLPIPIARAALTARVAQDVPASWQSPP